MKQHKRLRFVSIVCLAALLVSCLPGAYAYGVSSAWAREELDAMAALDLIPALLEERGDLRENITRLEMCALAVQAYEHYTGEELSLPDETPFPDTNDPSPPNHTPPALPWAMRTAPSARTGSSPGRSFSSLFPAFSRPQASTRLSMERTWPALWTPAPSAPGLWTPPGRW